MDIEKHQQFAERLIRNQNRVFRYLISLVPNRADAEELFQQTCLTLWENWERYDSELDFVPWACGIAHNHVRNFMRKEQGRPVALDTDVVELLAKCAESMVVHEDDKLAALRLCLNSLTLTNRTLIEGYYGGRSVEELASGTSVTPKSVYKLLHKIRQALHDCVSMRLAQGVVR